MRWKYGLFIGNAPEERPEDRVKICYPTTRQHCRNYIYNCGLVKLHGSVPDLPPFNMKRGRLYVPEKELLFLLLEQVFYFCIFIGLFPENIE